MKLQFSRLAEADLAQIARYTLEHWGEEQATRYLDHLEAACGALAEHPALGRRCDYIRPGLHRYEVQQHVLFFRLTGESLLVSRILHRRMLPLRHQM